MATIWFDVSLITTGVTNAGIPRTERELARELLLRSEPKVVFFRTSGTSIEVIHRQTVQSACDGGGVAVQNQAATIEPAPFFSAGDVIVSTSMFWRPIFGAIKRQHGVKLVYFCYDLIPVNVPHFLPDMKLHGPFFQTFTEVARQADAVLCISRNTAADFHAFCDRQQLRKPPCEVITLGSNIPEDRQDLPLAQLSVLLQPRRYILFVSTLANRKNHDAIYRAYVRLAEQGKNDLPRALFVGAIGWGVGDLMHALNHDPRIRNRILLYTQADDKWLATLYRNCLFTVFPSVFEGWGLPVAESLAYGKFCIAADTPALREAGGDLVEYLDPWDTGTWASAIERYSTNVSLLESREARIRTSYEVPTWSQACNRLTEVALSR